MIENKLKQFFIGLVFLSVVFFMAGGCSNTWKGVKKDSEKVGEAIEDTYENAKKKLEN